VDCGQALYDLIMLGFRTLLLIPMLAAKSGFVEAMVMMALASAYYIYYRGNDPFIKFEVRDQTGWTMQYPLSSSR
jgi:hypothetical protein